MSVNSFNGRPITNYVICASGCFVRAVGSSAVCWDELRLDGVSPKAKAFMTTVTMVVMSSAVSDRGIESGGVSSELVGGRVRSRFTADVCTVGGSPTFGRVACSGSCYPGC